MEKETLSTKHGVSIIALIIIGSSLALGVNKETVQDTWIAMLISIIATIPLVLVYARIIKLYPQKNIFDILTELFGVVFSKIFILAILFFSIFLGSLVLRNFTEFINITALHKTPQIVVGILIMTVIFYLVKSGTQTLGKWSFLMLFAIIVIVIITIILALCCLDFKHIFPIMSHKPTSILKSSLSYNFV